MYRRVIPSTPEVVIQEIKDHSTTVWAANVGMQLPEYLYNGGGDDLLAIIQ